jgi:alpha-galactosidase
MAPHFGRSYEQVNSRHRQIIKKSLEKPSMQSKGQPLVARRDSVSDLQNGLAKLPPMGWNSWNHFGCNVNETIIKQTVDMMVESGMKTAGYEYIIIDDCWMATYRAKDGKLIANSKRFPHGIKWLADYVHSKGLKLGIYESAGAKTCQGYPGSFHHEQTDAKTFARWGIDFLKYDDCMKNRKKTKATVYKKRYIKMAKALLATGRPIVYSIHTPGTHLHRTTKPWKWAPKIANEWRTTNDIRDNWQRVMWILDQQVGLSQFAGPGHWNNPDMLEVGNGGMTPTEDKAHFSLWAILAAPLIAGNYLGNDLRPMSSKIKKILTNKEVIAVDQDPAGKQGYKVTDNGNQEVWVKPMSDGSEAVLFLNRGNSGAFMTANASKIGLPNSGKYKIQNLWEHKSYTSEDLIRAEVPSHGVAMFRVWVK